MTVFFFCKQKTAYEMRISDWSSDVCSSDLGSHQGKGWEGFTDHVVETLNREREGLVFLLWGAYAQKKGAVIDPRRHRVLKTTHPSPLSAHRGFLGCGHFSAANAYLARNGQAPIDWSLPPRAQLEAA